MCVNMCVGECVDMDVDMCADVYVDMCADTGIGICVDKPVAMCRHVQTVRKHGCDGAPKRVQTCVQACE